jgi:hypothetical protein
MCSGPCMSCQLACCQPSRMVSSLGVCCAQELEVVSLSTPIQVISTYYLCCSCMNCIVCKRGLDRMTHPLPLEMMLMLMSWWVMAHPPLSIQQYNRCRPCAAATTRAGSAQRSAQRSAATNRPPASASLAPPQQEQQQHRAQKKQQGASPRISVPPVLQQLAVVACIRIIINKDTPRPRGSHPSECPV